MSGRQAWRLAIAAALVVVAALVLSACAGGGSGPAAGTATSQSRASQPTAGRSTAGRPTADRSTAPGSTATPTGPATTAMRVFRPFRSDGTPTAGVRSRQSGSCFTTSITVAAPLAFRCFAANQILDPCFARARAARTLTCYTSPWSTATQLRLTGALATMRPLKISRPWAIELAGGLRCVAITGTTDVSHGVTLGYQCPGALAGLRNGTGPAERALVRAKDATVRDLVVVAEWRA